MPTLFIIFNKKFVNTKLGGEEPTLFLLLIKKFVNTKKGGGTKCQYPVVLKRGDVETSASHRIYKSYKYKIGRRRATTSIVLKEEM